MRHNRPDLPLWLNEGLAELYSSFQLRGKKAAIGRPIDSHIHWLRDHALIPVGELFAIDHSSKDYNEGSRRGVFYAQSWALRSRGPWSAT